MNNLEKAIQAKMAEYTKSARNEAPEMPEFLKALIEGIQEMREQPKQCPCKSEKPDCQEDWRDEILPGRLVVFKADADESPTLGVILEGGAIMRISSKGQVLGYLQNYTEKYPYQIQAIYEPDEENFMFNNIADMELCYEAPAEKKKKLLTKADIAELLGVSEDEIELA